MKAILARPYAPHLIAAVLYTLLALVMTAPLALRPGDHLLGTDSNALNDTFFSVWIFGWQAHALIADPLNLFQGNIFYPFQNSLAFSEIILPGALLYLPLEYASGNPVLAYNLVLLATFPLNGLAMYLYATSAIGEEESSPHVVWSAAFAAGVIFAFCTYKMGELRHVQLLMGMFMPLTLMYATRFLRAPRLPNAFLLALFFALNALSSLYYAVFLAFAVALLFIVELLTGRFRITRVHLIYAALAGVLVVALVLPFLLPFFLLERQYNFSEGRDPRLFSARPYSYIAAPASQWLYGTLTRPFYVASKGQPLFPGIVATLLGAVGSFALLRAKSRAWIFPLLLGLMGLTLSFGPELLLGRTSTPVLPFPLPYHYLAQVISPLASLNAPARFAILSMLALALLSAYGLAYLLRQSPRWGWAIAVLCIGAIALEYIPAPLRLARADAGANISPAYQFLAQQPRGEPVVEIPMGKPTFADQDRYVEYTYNSLYHLHPLVNGYSTFLPPEYYALVRDVQPFPTKRSLKRLEKWGVVWVVVHADRLEKRESVRKKLDSLAGIMHVQDFGDIWLYQIER
jgi:hypothetical protein